MGGCSRACIADGVTLWELFTDAETPYAFVNSDEAVAEHVCDGGRLRAPRSCPPALWALVQRCWAASAQERPAFQELLVELRAITGVGTEVAMGDSVVLPTSQPVELPMGRPVGEGAVAVARDATAPIDEAVAALTVEAQKFVDRKTPYWGP